MKFNDIRNNFNNELALVDSFIVESLKSEVELIDDIGKYIVFFGGKRIRPLISILFSKMISYNINNTILMASIIELIHTATLLHDDVVDLSEKRRGKLSINKVWGNKEAILVGDFLYTRSFQMMVSLNNMDVLKLMSETTNIMSEGEVNQLVHKRNFNITELDYFKIIKAKTAQLFSASASSIALLANMDDIFCKAAYNYGMNLGIAYQLVDDALDYTADEKIFGKNIGDDIFSGTFTLPLIYLILNDSDKKNKIIEIINNNFDNEKKSLIKNWVLNSGGVEYTLKLAEKHINLAKESLVGINSNEYTKMAVFLSDFIVERKY